MKRAPRSLAIDPAQLAAVRARLLAKRELNGDGCWYWAGAQMPQRRGECSAERPDDEETPYYGRCKIGGRAEYAHRASFAAWVRPLKVGEYVLHSCDNPACFNPDHLSAGDLSRNNWEMWQRARGAEANGQQRVEFQDEPPF